MERRHGRPGNEIDRKEFMTLLGRAGAAGCMCGAALGARLMLGDEPAVHAQEPAPAPQTKPGEASAARAAKRMEFVDQWVPRFFRVLDGEVDEQTRRRLMVANGKACFGDYRPDLTRRTPPATRAEIAAFVAKRGKDAGYSMEGEAIAFEYVGSAETGQPSPPNVCLCPTAEAHGARRLSPTFCWCSMGYVQEMHERVFGRPVRVEILQAVLMGHPRCRFRITLA